jgi:hypothetical protein
MNTTTGSTAGVSGARKAKEVVDHISLQRRTLLMRLLAEHESARVRLEPGSTTEPA